MESRITSKGLDHCGFRQVEGAPLGVFTNGTLTVWPEFIGRFGNARWEVELPGESRPLPWTLAPITDGHLILLVGLMEAIKAEREIES